MYFISISHCSHSIANSWPDTGITRKTVAVGQILDIVKATLAHSSVQMLTLKGITQPTNANVTLGFGIDRRSSI